MEKPTKAMIDKVMKELEIIINSPIAWDECFRRTIIISYGYAQKEKDLAISHAREKIRNNSEVIKKNYGTKYYSGLRDGLMQFETELMKLKDEVTLKNKCNDLQK